MLVSRLTVATPIPIKQSEEIPSRHESSQAATHGDTTLQAVTHRQKTLQAVTQRHRTSQAVTRRHRT